MSGLIGLICIPARVGSAAAAPATEVNAIVNDWEAKPVATPPGRGVKAAANEVSGSAGAAPAVTEAKAAENEASGSAGATPAVTGAKAIVNDGGGKSLWQGTGRLTLPEYKNKDHALFLMSFATVVRFPRAERGDCPGGR